MDDSAPRSLRVMDLAITAGAKLLANGAGAADVTETTTALCDHFGLHDTDVDVSYIVITVFHDQGLNHPPLTLRRKVPQRGTNAARLTAVARLVDDVLSGDVGLDDARERIGALDRSTPGRPIWQVRIGAGLLGAGVATALGAGPAGAASALVAALAIDLVRRPLTARRVPSFYVQAAGGLCASLIAVATAALPSTPPPRWWWRRTSSSSLRASACSVRSRTR